MYKGVKKYLKMMKYIRGVQKYLQLIKFTKSVKNILKDFRIFRIGVICLFDLWFYIPVNNSMVMLRWSEPNHMVPGQAT